MDTLQSYLKGGDLRSIAYVGKLVAQIKTQSAFDELFSILFLPNRLLVMRAADAIEKITLKNPQFLANYTKEIIRLLKTASNKELKWHLALIATRINFNARDFEFVWNKLATWAKDKKESKIVRVNSIQSLFKIVKPELKKELELILKEVESENIPSINARLKKLRKLK